MYVCASAGRWRVRVWRVCQRAVAHRSSLLRDGRDVRVPAAPLVSGAQLRTDARLRRWCLEMKTFVVVMFDEVLHVAASVATGSFDVRRTGRLGGAGHLPAAGSGTHHVLHGPYVVLLSLPLLEC